MNHNDNLASKQPGAEQCRNVSPRLILELKPLRYEKKYRTYLDERFAPKNRSAYHGHAVDLVTLNADVMKYRVWNNATKKFLRTSTYIDSDGNLYKDNDPHGLDMSGKRSISPMPNCTVMRSTGLHDKNGAPIFEGDLIRVEMCECTGHDDEGNEIWIDCEGPVSFEDGAFVFYGHSAGTIPLNAYIENITIIGHIYEDHERQRL